MHTRSDNQKSIILDVLSAENRSLSISMIAQKTGINRHTVARHLDLLEMFGKVRKVEKGVAKKYMIIEDIPVSGLIDLSEDLIIILDSNFYIQYLNSAALKFFKTTLSNSIGKNLSDISLPLPAKHTILDQISNFSFKKPTILEIKNEDQRWFQITILGYSLLHAPNQIAIIFTDITLKKKIETELKIAQEKYSIAFQSSPDAILISDITTGELIEVNEATCTISGYSREELIGKNTNELGFFKDPVIRDRVLHNLSLNISNNRLDTEIVRKNGETAYISLVANKIQIGSRICLLSTARDITEIKEAQEKIKKSEELYRLLADNTQDVIWILNLTTQRFTYVSPSVYRLRGFTPEEVLTQSMQEVMTKESYEKIMSKVPQIVQNIRNGTISPYNTSRVDQIRKDGTIVTTEVVTSFLSDRSGKYSHVLGVSRDISTRIKIEEKLRESEAKYRLVSENVHDLIWMISADTHNILFVSPSIRNYYGYLPEEVAGSPFSTLIPEPLYADMMKKLHQNIISFESGDESKRNFRFEIEHLHRDGHRLTTEVSITLITTTSRKVVNILGLSRDITEEKHNKHALLKSEAMFKSIFNESPIGHILCNHYGNIIEINPVLMDEFGIENNSVLIGQCAWNIIPLTNEEHITILSGNKISREINISFDYLWKMNIIPTNRCNTAIFDMKITPLLTMNPDEVGYLIHLLDITEKRKIENELKVKRTQ